MIADTTIQHLLFVGLIAVVLDGWYRGGHVRTIVIVGGG
jgi:hypothetical protein